MGDGDRKVASAIAHQREPAGVMKEEILLRAVAYGHNILKLF